MILTVPKPLHEPTGLHRVSFSEVDYNQNESIDKLYQYGTLGYAAPECYSKAANGSAFPFTIAGEHGINRLVREGRKD